MPPFEDYYIYIAGAVLLLSLFLILRRRASKREEEMGPELIRVQGPIRYHIIPKGTRRIVTKVQKRFRPRMKRGMVELFGGWYKLDPRKQGIAIGRRMRSLWLIPFDQPFQIWKEGKQEPLDIFEMAEELPEPKDSRDPDVIGAWYKETFTDKIMRRRPDIVVMILMLVIGVIAGIAFSQYQPANGGP